MSHELCSKGIRVSHRLHDRVEKAAKVAPVVNEVGEEVLRKSLEPLSVEQLKDIVADHGMDPGKLVMKWKDAGRIIDRIVEIAIGRAQKGNAFRPEADRH